MPLRQYRIQFSRTPPYPRSREPVEEESWVRSTDGERYTLTGSMSRSSIVRREYSALSMFIRTNEFSLLRLSDPRPGFRGTVLPMRADGTLLGPRQRTEDNCIPMIIVTEPFIETSIPLFFTID